jgi:flagellar biosynthesis/type III secretory pathway protein FliH
MIHHFYKSPITIETDLVHKTAALMIEESKKSLENAIYEAVLSCNVIVDKEELEKALRYDRGRWEEGYNAGYSEGLEKGKAEALARIKELLEGGDEDD